MQQLKHINHAFVPVGEGVYIVKCKQTGGSFSTILWREGKEQQQRCPCCGEQIK